MVIGLEMGRPGPRRTGETRQTQPRQPNTCRTGHYDPRSHGGASIPRQHLTDPSQSSIAMDGLVVLGSPMVSLFNFMRVDRESENDSYPVGRNLAR